MSSELGRLLALRRVRRGGIAQFDDRVFIDHGCPVPGYIGSNLTVLLADGHVRPGRPQESTGYLPLLLTDQGEVSYTELTDSYQRQLRASRPTASG